jgi:hypothetical protein
VEGLAVAVAVTSAPDTPVAGVAVSHAALDVTDQDGALVVGTTVVESAPEVAVHPVLDKVRVGAAAAWVTVTVRVTPPAVNVRVAWRVWVVEGLAVTVAVAFVPDGPAAGVTVSHSALVVTAHAGALVVGTTVVVAVSEVGVQVVGDKLRVGAAPAWVTVSVRVTPPAVNVRVAWRAWVEGLAAAVAVAFAPDAPVVGVAVSHVWLEVTDQDGALVVGTTVVESVPEVAVHVVLDKVRVAPAPAWMTTSVRVTPPAVNVRGA